MWKPSIAWGALITHRPSRCNPTPFLRYVDCSILLVALALWWKPSILVGLVRAGSGCGPCRRIAVCPGSIWRAQFWVGSGCRVECISCIPGFSVRDYPVARLTVCIVSKHPTMWKPSFACCTDATAVCSVSRGSSWAGGRVKNACFLAFLRLKRGTAPMTSRWLVGCCVLGFVYIPAHAPIPIHQHNIPSHPIFITPISISTLIPTYN